jgi:hypothetical protein
VTAWFAAATPWDVLDAIGCPTLATAGESAVGDSWTAMHDRPVAVALAWATWMCGACTGVSVARLREQLTERANADLPLDAPLADVEVRRALRRWQRNTGAETYSAWGQQYDALSEAAAVGADIMCVLRADGFDAEFPDAVT